MLLQRMFLPIFIILICSPSTFSTLLPKFVNVERFGVKGDGTDDSQAFRNAWKEACSSKDGAVFVVPQKRVYILEPITFLGPCKSNITMKIYGMIKASTNISAYKKDRRRWLAFENIQNLIVEGGGNINGNGRVWWKNSCKINKSRPCIGAPTALTFSECKNLRVANLRIEDSQQMHLSFQECVNVQCSHLTIIAPEHSPNTDGIHVTDTQNIVIMKSIIRTGDDCVSIVGGSKNVRVTDIACGPGHGISIGSLGKNKSEDKVSDILVARVTLSGTTNGVRLKSWQGGAGYAKNIRFQNIVMRNVTNPIIIDQNYCDRKKNCPEQYSAVQVENVLYKNIRGTSASETAIKFDCSKTFPCKGIIMQDLNLLHQGHQDGEASCKNVRLTTAGRVYPRCS